MPKGQKRKLQIEDGNDDEPQSNRTPPKAAGRKKTKAGKQSVEKRVDANGRTVRFSASPSQKVRERIARALPGSGHRMIFMDRTVEAPIGSEGGPIELFAVCGATGNVYQVKVGRFPHCSCPDFAKGNICKHYLYVMLRVLRLRQGDPLLWQKALLLSEAEEVFSGSRSTRTEEEVIANSALQQEWRRLQGDSSAGAAAAEPTEASKPVEGDCPICYDEMHPGGDTLQLLAVCHCPTPCALAMLHAEDLQTRVVACGICRNYIHESCFLEWKKQKKTLHQDVTCVYCRNPWLDSSASGGLDGEYVNLKSLSTEHRNADTSLPALYGDNARHPESQRSHQHQETDTANL